MVVESRGPWGVRNIGDPWSFKSEKLERITEVIVAHGDNITGLGIITVKPTSDGNWTACSHMFGNFQEKLAKVVLKKGEYITQITGEIAAYYDDKTRLITKLNIHTNMVPNGYGAYGYADGCRDIEKFSSPVVPNTQIVGFFGTHAHKIRSIGTYTANAP